MNGLATGTKACSTRGPVPAARTNTLRISTYDTPCGGLRGTQLFHLAIRARTPQASRVTDGIAPFHYHRVSGRHAFMLYGYGWKGGERARI